MAIFHSVTDFEMKEIKKDCWELIKYNGTPYANIEIPSCIDGKKIFSLGERLFSGAGFLKSVKINDGITRIGNNAFYLSEVSHVEFPQSLEHIGDEAFYWTPKLKKIFIPCNVKYIGERAFNGLNEIKIENGCTAPLTSEGSLRALETLYVPESVTKISKKIFWVVVAQPSTTEAVKDESGHVVRNAMGEVVTHEVHHSSSNIIIPKGLTIYCHENSAAYSFCEKNHINTEDYNVSSIKSDVLYSDFIEEHATSLVVPAHIRVIKKGAFSHRKLTSITFEEGSNIEEIEDDAFCGTLIESICFPRSLKRISKKAFYGCRNLKKISFEENSSLEFIGDSAFSYCGQFLSYIHRIILPSSIKELGKEVFKDSAIQIADFSKAVLLTTLPQALFEHCEYLTQISLPKEGKLKMIETRAFYGTAIKTFDFYNIEYIGKSAFYSCLNLKSVTIPIDCEEHNAFLDYNTTIIRKNISRSDTPSFNLETIADKAKQVFKNLFK